MYYFRPEAAASPLGANVIASIFRSIILTIRFIRHRLLICRMQLTLIKNLQLGFYFRSLINKIGFEECVVFFPLERVY